MSATMTKPCKDALMYLKPDLSDTWKILQTSATKKTHVPQVSWTCNGPKDYVGTVVDEIG